MPVTDRRHSLGRFAHRSVFIFVKSLARRRAQQPDQCANFLKVLAGLVHCGAPGLIVYRE
jgi:hypothetical protein